MAASPYNWKLPEWVIISSIFAQSTSKCGAKLQEVENHPPSFLSIRSPKVWALHTRDAQSITGELAVTF